MLLAAACSSSDDSGDEDDETAAPTTTEADGSDETAAPTPTEADGGGDDDGGDVDLGDLGVLSSDDCLAASQSIAAAFSGGFGQFIDPDEIADAFDQLGAAAPSDIADDLDEIGNTLAEFYNVLQDAGIEDLSDPSAFADPEIAQKIADAAEELDTDAFNEAADNVDAWFTENCNT